MPHEVRRAKLKSRQVYLVASGDLRESANRACWAAQTQMEEALGKAVASCGFEIVRAHPFKPDAGHGFIASQKEGMRVFAALDPDARLIVAEAVWQYSHHVLAGLTSHRGPILTVANWSGQWPGLVGMLNLNGSLTKAGVAYSTLWAEDFGDPTFVEKLRRWLKDGEVRHPLKHVTRLKDVRIPSKERKLGEALAAQLQREKAILGVFDEGCMGMFNAIIPDHLLHPTGVYKERLSQSALYAATMQVPESEGREVYDWLRRAGMRFVLGRDEATELTESQVLLQCRMYVAAVRIAHEFGCNAIGIQYQQGLKDCLPASDLVEGMLNNADRPPVRSAGDGKVLYDTRPLPHFNEVDECAGLDGLMTYWVHRAMGEPVENTLHDLRWGDADRSGTTEEYVWVFEISGAAPPAHFIDGWRGATGERQPPMYFRLGGSTLKGVSRPGEIVWSRIYIERDRLHMDLGRAKVVRLPDTETQRRWQATTPQWPIMHAVLHGVTRDQMMAKHKANHVQVAYATDAAAADRALYAKAAMADALGIRVHLCGTRAEGKAW
ncbi:MAG: fucose isomerase [Phycisphaerae bacterium]|nr:MAG: fucose isomerase [Planctomycetota bacterium]KAB2942487.1 MAG: fucose isomerase [Phycisphaerae bacterium]MBE7456614.1 fucose isomerase [Planctomycetia bacterium]MCL4718221.1 fucose isomerase [Phycisphaerae bacterium]MCQ3920642.1 fucose isomerase [Planctomycetota bacterium]